MKPILVAAAVIAVLGVFVGAVSHGPSRPLHDELRWTESSSSWANRASRNMDETPRS